MKRVLRNSFFLAMTIMVGLSGCTKDDVDYRTGTGIVKVNGKEDSISEVTVKTSNYDSLYHYYGSSYGYSGYGSCYPNKDNCTLSHFHVNDNGILITFYNEKKHPVVTVNLKDPELSSNTYTSREGGIYFVAISMNDDYYGIDFETVVMVVDKSGSTYDISITGKTLLGEHEYTVTYKGIMREQR